MIIIEKKNLFQKSNERKGSKDLQSWLKVDFWDFTNHPTVHSGRLESGGSVALTVGVSDI